MGRGPGLSGSGLFRCIIPAPLLGYCCLRLLGRVFTFLAWLASPALLCRIAPVRRHKALQPEERLTSGEYFAVCIMPLVSLAYLTVGKRDSGLFRCMASPALLGCGPYFCWVGPIFDHSLDPPPGPSFRCGFPENGRVNQLSEISLSGYLCGFDRL